MYSLIHQIYQTISCIYYIIRYTKPYFVLINSSDIPNHIISCIHYIIRQTKPYSFIHSSYIPSYPNVFINSSDIPNFIHAFIDHRLGNLCPMLRFI